MLHTVLVSIALSTNPGIAVSETLKAGRELSAESYDALHAAFKSKVTKPKAAVLLRLAYHDAGTYSISKGGGGVNGSIRYELDRPENTGLNRGVRVIDEIRALLSNTAAAEISTADVIALAGAYSVTICGGPSIKLQVGRQDATVPDPTGRLPDQNASVEVLKASFADKGLTVKEMIALSGAHTLGGKGFGDPVAFDNTYYKSLLQKPWLNKNDSMASMIGLPSDHVLPEDKECLEVITEFAQNQDAFFSEFARCYAKMANLGVTWK